jgi:hypothetical protein
MWVVRFTHGERATVIYSLGGTLGPRDGWNDADKRKPLALAGNQTLVLIARLRVVCILTGILINRYIKVKGKAIPVTGSGGP